jgi:hypothetical protein
MPESLSIGTSPLHEPRIPRTVERALPKDQTPPGWVRGLSVECRQWVESGCGAVAVGWAYLFPPLSSGGALVAQP